MYCMCAVPTGECVVWLVTMKDEKSDRASVFMASALSNVVAVSVISGATSTLVGMPLPRYIYSVLRTCVRARGITRASSIF